MDRETLVNDLNGRKIKFQNQQARIGKRNDLKKGQGILYAYNPENHKAISSLYFTNDPDILALEVDKKHFILNAKTLKILPDTENFYERSKNIPQTLSESL